MAKIQRNFRLEPDVDAALSKASSDSDPKTAIVDRALRVELGLVDGTPADGNPPSESREPTDEDVRIWFRGLDGIDQQKIMVGLGLAPPPTASTASFEAILDQVEAAPEETRRAVLERLLGEQLKGPEPEGAQPSWATAPGEPDLHARVLTATERAIAEEISAEQGLDRETAERMARQIVQKRAEAAR